MQTSEARPQALLVAPAQSDVPKRRVHSAVVEDAAGVLDHDLGAVLAQERTLGAELAGALELCGPERSGGKLGLGEQLVGMQAAQLIEGPPEKRGGGFVRVENHIVRAEDEDRVGRLVVQLPVAALARRELRNHFGVAQRDRRSGCEHPDLLDACVVERLERGAADPEHAADPSVPFNRHERDRRRARGQAPVDLGACRLPQHGEAASDAGRTERLLERERLPLQRQVGACTDTEVGEAVLDGRETRRRRVEATSAARRSRA